MTYSQVHETVSPTFPTRTAKLVFATHIFPTYTASAAKVISNFVSVTYLYFFQNLSA